MSEAQAVVPMWEMDSISHINKYCGNEGSLPASEVLLASLQKELADLHVEAEKLGDEYWAQIREINKTKKSSDKSRLGIRARNRTKVVTIEWIYQRHVFVNGNERKTMSNYLKKGRGASYRVESILKYAKDWERDLVIETETRASILREQSLQRVLLMDAIEKYIDSQT